MPYKFLGEKSVLYMQDIVNGGDVLVAICHRTKGYERQREIIEVTALDSNEVGHVLGLKRGRASFSALSVFLATGETGVTDEVARQWFEDGKLLYCELVDTYDATHTRTIPFFAYAESYRVNRNIGEPATFDFDMVITKPKAADFPIPVCPTITWTVRANSISGTFTGLPGISYAFTLTGGPTITVTDAPYEFSFTGLTPSTDYEITLEATNDNGSTSCGPYPKTTTAYVCPFVVFGPTNTTIEFQFEDTNEGADVWVMMLYEGLTVVDSIVFSGPFSGNLLTHTFTGLTEGTDYTLKLLASFGGTEIECGPFDVRTTGGITFEIINNIVGASVESVQLGGVDFATLSAGSFPISFGETGEGTQIGGTGALQVVVSGTFTQGHMTLNYGGGFFECVDFNGAAGTYAFASNPYNSAILVTITLNENSCA